MKKQWIKPELETLDVKMTMKWHGSADDDSCDDDSGLCDVLGES